jgi:hypothetical protein
LVGTPPGEWRAYEDGTAIMFAELLGQITGGYARPPLDGDPGDQAALPRAT